MSDEPTERDVLSETEREALAEAGYSRKVAWARTAITPWNGLADFQREQQCIPAVERVVERILAERIAEARREGAREALTEAADAWLHGAWGDTPRTSDRVADRIGAAQYAGDWLRQRAAALGCEDT